MFSDPTDPFRPYEIALAGLCTRLRSIPSRRCDATSLRWNTFLVDMGHPLVKSACPSEHEHVTAHGSLRLPYNAHRKNMPPYPDDTDPDFSEEPDPEWSCDILEALYTPWVAFKYSSNQTTGTRSISTTNRWIPHNQALHRLVSDPGMFEDLEDKFVDKTSLSLQTKDTLWFVLWSCRAAHVLKQGTHRRNRPVPELSAVN